MARRTDWKARLGVGAGVCAAPVLAMMGIAGVLEPETPRAFALLLVPGLGLLAYLWARHRPLLTATLLAGVLAGWTLGAGIRFAMLIAALMGGGMDRTLTGTAGLVLFFALPGLVLSGLASGLRAFARMSPRTTALLVTLIGTAILLGTARGELFARGNGWLNLVTFTLSSALAGWVLGRVHDGVESWWQRRTLATV